MKAPAKSASPKPRKVIVFDPENTIERWTPAQVLAYPHEFEQCRFVDCDLADADLRNLRFIDCQFERCNLALAKVGNAGFQSVQFIECKLTGLQFTACRDMLFEVRFERCKLDYASFFGKKMPRTPFLQCSLTEADFTNADLTEAVFQESTLDRALFNGTQLGGADFTTATGFVIDPALNPMRKAKFSLEGLPGLLAGYGIVVQ